MPSWESVVTAVAMIVVTAAVARLVDRRLARRELAPETMTRYRVLRRAVVTAIVLFGVLSALLTIPAVSRVAGTLLASTAVIGLIVGFAAQRTLGNVVAGLLIALSQPLRLGDRVRVAEVDGVVEEIGLTYTFIRADDQTRLVIPNEKLASDTIRNSTIVSREKVAEITVQVPITQDLGRVVDAIRAELATERAPEVVLTGLGSDATVVARVPAADADAARALEEELRLRLHRRLRGEGVFAA
jgi:small-conductance mechanosensitive channel